jgi:hypothetical protein
MPNEMNKWLYRDITEDEMRQMNDDVTGAMKLFREK